MSYFSRIQKPRQVLVNKIEVQRDLELLAQDSGSKRILTLNQSIAAVRNVSWGSH